MRRSDFPVMYLLAVDNGHVLHVPRHDPPHVLNWVTGQWLDDLTAAAEQAGVVHIDHTGVVYRLTAAGRRALVASTDRRVTA